MKSPDTAATSIAAPVSIGELFDKITILRIKAARISAADKLRNVHEELGALQGVADTITLTAEMRVVIEELQQVNQQLWDIEDAIRDCERAQDFGAAFVALARSVYQTNDRRADLKKQLNLLCGSALCEEKSYAAY